MKYYRVNNKITAPQVRLINENGEHLDIVEIKKALEIARSKELDLVEISPNTNPPIVKILNFSHLKYDLKKKKDSKRRSKKLMKLKGYV